MTTRLSRHRFCALFLLPVLGACGPGAGSPEGVATRFLQAQVRGSTDDQLALVTDADRAAATQDPNTQDTSLHPAPDSLAFLNTFAKRVRLGRAATQVDGDTATVTVAGRAPDVDLEALVVSALFGGGEDETIRRRVAAGVADAPLRDTSQTLTLIREGGRWRVDTGWAEQAQAAAEQQLEADYASGDREDFTRSLAAARKLAALHPDDAGWREGVNTYQTAVSMLDDFTVEVQTADIYQGEYQIVSEVHNGTDFPLRSLTVRYTFFNGARPVGEPAYHTFRGMAFFNPRILGANATSSAESSGTPPDGWTGGRIQGEVTAFSIDGG